MQIDHVLVPEFGVFVVETKGFGYVSGKLVQIYFQPRFSLTLSAFETRLLNQRY